MHELLTVDPDESSAELAERALSGVQDYLASHPGPAVPLIASDEEGDPLVVPREAMELMAGVLAHLSAGRSVRVVPGHAELTTQEAADLLHVSRPFLIGLLQAGEIEHRMVGTHRRILADSLMAYMRNDDARRRAAADELTQLTEEMGLY